MGASAWQGLIGVVGYKAGTSGTVTLPPGAVLIAFGAHASTGSATITVFGGDAIPVPSGTWFGLENMHTLFQAHGSGASAQLVFTNTDSYFVEYVTQGHAT